MATIFTKYSPAPLLLLLITFFSALHPLTAQRQYENWYFGQNAGISFAGGTAVPLLDGRIRTVDGSATISNAATGALLFYSDGKSVWDSTHSLMPNGTGLAGHESSGQPALIVPDPGDGERYYLFTTGAANTPTTATRYSVVDMRSNGGRGDVVEKNTLLLESGTEKLTATRHCNGVDYWVLAHTYGSNEFYAYLVTARGIADTVISAVGVPYPSSAEAQGTFQISPDGTLLSVTTPRLKTVEVFDFDRATGLVSNQRLIGDGDVQYYGQEFSPDNSKLYVNTLPQSSNPAYLYQYDLAAGDVAAIRASRFEMIELRERAWQGGQLQLGGDGRIYVAWDRSTALGVIARPNQTGAAAGYTHNGFSLGGRASSYGLPNVIDSDLGVPGGSSGGSISTRLRYTTTSSLPGESVDIELILCNTSTTDLATVDLDLQLAAGLSLTSGTSGPYNHGPLAAGTCDTVIIATARVDAQGGSMLESCLSFSRSAPELCAPPRPVCATLEVRSLPVDTGEVDYTFYLPWGCPGTNYEGSVLFNSRRFTDTITGVSFVGPGARQFSYGGPRPVRFVIRPTTDQRIPIRMQRRRSGETSATMILTTAKADTFRIRLRTTIKPSTSPFLDITELRLGSRSGTIDTCIQVTNILAQPVAIVDTVWFRGGSGASITSPTLPVRLNPGASIELCFRIGSAGPGASDTLVLGGSEIREECPYCFHHTLVIDDRAPNLFLSAPSATASPGDGMAISIAPNRTGDIAYLYVTDGEPQQLSVELFDAAGRIVTRLEIDRASRGADVVPIDVSNLVSGRYEVRVRNRKSGDVHSRPLIVVR